MTENDTGARFHPYKIIIVVAVVIAALVLILGLHSGKVCAVMVNGDTIAYAQSEGAAKKVIEALAAEKEKELGQEVHPEAGLELKTIKSSKTPIQTDELSKVLVDKVNFVTTGTMVTIDGKPQLSFKNRDIADKFFNQLKDKYNKGDECKISFLEDVDTVDKQVVINELNTVEEALQLAENGRGEPVIHIVEEGDTLWDLAAKHDTSVENLQKLNPGIDENLQLGQEVKVSGSSPLLTVLASYKLTEKVAIPFKTEYNDDSSLPMGTRKIVQEGSEGSKNVTYQVLSQNGKITEKTVLDEEIIEEPVSRIIKRGTKFVLSSRGGGLIWPVSGHISSPFGQRWGGTHSGVDIAAGYGDPIRTAGPGRVITAGWGGGYGNTVVISHSNGIYTRYAHLSSIGVRRGQNVNQGEFIGRVGTSGNSTGPHLHFEVIVNGVTRNPLNYL